MLSFPSPKKKKRGRQSTNDDDDETCEKPKNYHHTVAPLPPEHQKPKRKGISTDIFGGQITFDDDTTYVSVVGTTVFLERFGNPPSDVREKI